MFLGENGDVRGQLSIQSLLPLKIASELLISNQLSPSIFSAMFPFIGEKKS